MSATKLKCLVCALVLTACGVPGRPALLGVRSTGPSESGKRTRLMEVARSLTKPPLEVRGITFDADPVGYLRAAYWGVGLDLFDFEAAKDPAANGLEILIRSARARSQIVEVPALGNVLVMKAASGSTMVFIVTEFDARRLSLLGWLDAGPSELSLEWNAATREQTVTIWDPFS